LDAIVKSHYAVRQNAAPPVYKREKRRMDKVEDFLIRARVPILFAHRNVF
jgi:hypothetical protein